MSDAFSSVERFLNGWKPFAELSGTTLAAQILALLRDAEHEARRQHLLSASDLYRLHDRYQALDLFREGKNERAEQFERLLRISTAEFAAAIEKRFVQVPVPLKVARAFFSPKPVQRFFGMPVEALDYFDDPVRHDTTTASQDLSELGIECPRLADYLPRLVAFYRAHREQVRREAMI